MVGMGGQAGTSEPRNLGTEELRNPRTEEPQNFGTQEPRNYCCCVVGLRVARSAFNVSTAFTICASTPFRKSAGVLSM